MITREQALALVKQYVKTENSIKHMLATEAIMKALARHFKEEEEVWGLAGLLHDIDMEEVDYLSEPEKHGPRSVEILKEHGIDNQIILDAVIAHNEATGKSRETLIEKAIYAVDPLTGLIVATTLVMPERKLAAVRPENVLNRFKEKAFARGAKREIIASCQDFGLNLEEFVEIGLKAMQSISTQLGL